MKGLVEFRKVEKDAMRTQEDCRVQAKETDRIENTRQAGLFSALQLAEHLADPDPRAEDRKQARQWVVRELNVGPLPYEDCRVEVLQAYSVTEPELKDLLVGLRNEGLAEFDGMKWRQRKPDEGVTIRPRAAA